MNITIEQARKVLEVVDAGLVNGMGEPVPGKMCVEAAVCYALGEPHSDEPSCVANSVRRFKIRLNDSAWSSNQARTTGMRKLAIAQLGSKGIDEVAFAKVLAKLTIQRVLPPILRKVGLEKEAVRCEAEGTRESATAAKNAACAADAAYAAYAADYADYAAADYADYAAADYADYAAAADAAADAAAARKASSAFRDQILTISADCCLDALRAVNAPGIALLDQLGI